MHGLQYNSDIYVPVIFNVSSPLPGMSDPEESIVVEISVQLQICASTR